MESVSDHIRRKKRCLIGLYDDDMMLRSTAIVLQDHQHRVGRGTEIIITHQSVLGGIQMGMRSNL